MAKIPKWPKLSRYGRLWQRTGVPLPNKNSAGVIQL